MADRFSPADLTLLRDAREVRIETRAHDRSPSHRTVIWVVVDDDDRVLIRTYRGPRSRWYREAIAHPACRLHVEGRTLEVRAAPAADRDRVEAYSAAMARKYASSRSMPLMLAADLLPTTLELVPG